MVSGMRELFGQAFTLVVSPGITARVPLPDLLPSISHSGAVVVSVIAGTIEILSPDNDNLLIPVAACAVPALVPVPV
jgi:dolichol kinase